MRRHTGSLVLLIFCALLCSCVTRDAPPTSAPVDLSTAARAVRTVETGAAFGFEEFELPPLCRVEDVCGRSIALKATCVGRDKHDEVWLLDSRSGRHTAVMKHAVNRARGFDIGTVRVGEGHIAWEEVDPSEGIRMDEAEWRLYVGTLDSERRRVVETTEVAQGFTGVVRRPFFDLEDGRLYWAENEWKNPAQDSGRCRGTIMSLDLRSGIRKTVYSSPKNVGVMRVSDGRIICTQLAARGPGDDIIRVLFAESSAEETSIALHNVRDVSHYPDHHDGWTTWSLLHENESLASLYARSPQGQVYLLSDGGNDSAFVGPYIVFDAVEPSAPSVFPDLGRIWVFDTRTRERALVLETVCDTRSAWDVPMALPFDPESFVVVIDEFGVTPDGGTRVRIYDAGVWGDPTSGG